MPLAPKIFSNPEHLHIKPVPPEVPGQSATEIPLVVPQKNPTDWAVGSPNHVLLYSSSTSTNPCLSPSIGGISMSMRKANLDSPQGAPRSPALRPEKDWHSRARWNLNYLEYERTRSPAELFSPR